MSDDWQVLSMERTRVEADAAVRTEQAKAARIAAEGEAKATEIRAKIDLIAAETRQKIELDASYLAGKRQEIDLRAAEATALVPLEEAKTSQALETLEATHRHQQTMLELALRHGLRGLYATLATLAMLSLGWCP